MCGGVAGWSLVRSKSKIPRTEDEIQEIQFPDCTGAAGPDFAQKPQLLCGIAAITWAEAESPAAKDAWRVALTLGNCCKVSVEKRHVASCCLEVPSPKPGCQLGCAPSEEPGEDPPLLPQLLEASSLLKLTAAWRLC